MPYFLVLCYNSDTQSFEDMKLEDVARTVGENLNTVKARLYRALKKLRLDLEAGAYEASGKEKPR